MREACIDHLLDAQRYYEMNRKRPGKPHILWTLFRIWRVWRRYPQMRLGQLIECAMGIDDHGPNLFNIYDESLAARCEDLFKESR